MNRVTLLSVIIALVAGGLGHAGEVSADECKSLRIINKSYDEDLSQVEIDLENTSDRIVTAWRMTVLSGGGQGGQHVYGLDQDFFQSLGDLQKRKASPAPRVGAENRSMGPVYPGESVPVRWSIPLQPGDQGFGFPVIMVSISACIFEDLDWEGREDQVDGIFAARAVRLQDLEHMLGFIDAEMPVNHLDLEPRALLAQLEGESERWKTLAGSETDVNTPYPQALAMASAGRFGLSQLIDSAKGAIAATPSRAADLLRQIQSSLTAEYSLALRSVRPEDLEAAGRAVGR